MVLTTGEQWDRQQVVIDASFGQRRFQTTKTLKVLETTMNVGTQMESPDLGATLNISTEDGSRVKSEHVESVTQVIRDIIVEKQGQLIWI